MYDPLPYGSKKQEDEKQPVEQVKEPEEEKADFVSVLTLPGASKHFVCMGSGLWINCPAQKEEKDAATGPADEQVKEENRATGNMAVPQKIHAALELNEDWPALGEPQEEQFECPFELCDSQSEKK